VSEAKISVDDPRADDVRALLAVHLVFARAQTPPADAHALDVDGLLDPAVTFFSYRAGGTLLAIGALKELDPRHAEIKSMHTAQAARGRGIGTNMLEHLIAVARERGYLRVSLETGSMASFAAARSLYARAGFEPCEPFGDYRESRNSTYMTLRLGPPNAVPGRLRVDDPERRLAGVRLLSDLRLIDADFVRDDGGWVLDLPDNGLARLEYQLELSDHDGATAFVCDPGNLERAPGVFGEKSVLLAPGYRPPEWLEAPRVDGKFDVFAVRLLGRELSIGVWSPSDGELPLLVVHDGPEYDELAALTRYAGAMIEAGRVPPFRVALLPPADRNEWYSASAAYGRALCNRILPAIRDQVAVTAVPVGMGASLGGLAMLQAQRTWPGAFAGLFLQSGSFFVPRFDRHESRFPRYGRIVRFVRRVLRTATFPEPVPVAMTCGAEEENVFNNRLMASALGAQGYAADLVEVPDMHNYTGWRDALDPHLTGLLAGLWSPG
jgi:enterochelin esterase-like enzyme/GNAT superfamily N-acetyltransferase